MALRQCLRNGSRARALLHLVRTEQANCIEQATCSSAILRYQDPFSGDSTSVLFSTCNLPSSFLHRGFHVSFSPRQEITVASMGESITEGTISAILKKAGEKVEEDEPIMQIETDKVTIDVRAPQAGVLQHLLVKEDDTVTVGQLVAVMGSGEGAEVQKPAAAPAAPETDTAAVPAAPPPPPVEAPEPPSSGRQPSIKFPLRRTPDGVRISSLPAAQAKEHTAQPSPAAAPTQAGAPVATPKEREPRVAVPVGRWYIGQERGTKLSQSRVLTEREMEMIELGGAPP